MLKFFKKIDNQYLLKKDDLAKIQAVKPWNDPDLKSFRDSLRDHLGGQQFWRCAYCRQPIRDRQNENHLEHIINKAHYIWSTYLTNNIALSCPTCNAFKHYARNKLLSISGRSLASQKTLPHLTSHYEIVHPYVDDFFMHVVIHKSWLFSPVLNDGKLDLKGVSHIYIFQLYDLWRVERIARISRLAESDSKLKLISKSLSILLEGETKWRDLRDELKAINAQRKLNKRVDINKINDEILPALDNKYLKLLPKP